MKIVNLDDYRNKKESSSDNYLYSDEFFEDLAEFQKEQDLWDEFYDYVGQDLYDAIQSGKYIRQETFDMWGVKNIKGG
jgi:hypothetical protein